jgi:hypothetical protein
MTIKPNTSVKIMGFDISGQETWELATICRWTAVNGARMEGWHVVKFADGGKLIVHENRLRKS